MPNVSLNLVKKYDLLPASNVWSYLINFYPHKFRVKPTFARILLHVKFVNILK